MPEREQGMVGVIAVEEAAVEMEYDKEAGVRGVQSGSGLIITTRGELR